MSRDRQRDRRRNDPRGRTRTKVRVKSARGRKLSSTRWLERQLNDPYVAEAKRLGYRSRAAFKLLELNDKFGILKGVRRAVDLGCAPGGWVQILVQQLPQGSEIVGIDLLAVEPVEGATMLQCDFLDPDTPAVMQKHLNGPVDLLLSDMAAATTGHKQTDHLRTMALCEATIDFAEMVLVPGGTMVAKVLRGGAEGALLQRMKHAFTNVKHAKPPASRQESVEWYVVATGFRGGPSQS